MTRLILPLKVQEPQNSGAQRVMADLPESLRKVADGEVMLGELPGAAFIEDWLRAIADAVETELEARAEQETCRCWNEGQWGRVHSEDCPIPSHREKKS